LPESGTEKVYKCLEKSASEVADTSLPCRPTRINRFQRYGGE
jgi:hypothetical protein